MQTHPPNFEFMCVIAISCMCGASPKNTPHHPDVRQQTSQCNSMPAVSELGCSGFVRSATSIQTATGAAAAATSTHMYAN